MTALAVGARDLGFLPSISAAVAVGCRFVVMACIGVADYSNGAATGRNAVLNAIPIWKNENKLINYFRRQFGFPEGAQHKLIKLVFRAPLVCPPIHLERATVDNEGSRQTIPILNRWVMNCETSFPSFP